MISVVVTSYNAREHLAQCLTKLGEQSATWDEVIVVDNASTDGSPETVEDDFPFCRLLRLPENVGFGTANNRGAALGRGDSLLFLNSDAWLAEGALECLQRRLDDEAALAFVAPRLFYPDGRPQFVWSPETGVVGEALQRLRNRFESLELNHRLVPAMLSPLLGSGWWTAACLLVRRSAFEAVGGFDERFFLYFEDVDLSRRLRRAGWQMATVHEAKAFHVKGGSGSPAGEIAYRRSQLLYYSLHRPGWEQAFLRFWQRRQHGFFDSTTHDVR
jgi:GT2 family glycosyltransferase